MPWCCRRQRQLLSVHELQCPIRCIDRIGLHRPRRQAFILINLVYCIQKPFVRIDR